MKGLKGSLLAIAFFALGIALGRLQPIDAATAGEAASIALYLLIAFIGFEFGRHGLKDALRHLKPSMLLLPAVTVAATLIAVAAVSPLMPDFSVRECLTAGGGMGYYSLSSIIILDVKGPVAASLAMTALLANMVREALALVFIPVASRWIGSWGAISASGVTSMDVCLPVIAGACGESAVPLSIIHGVTLEVAVPVLVTLLCC